MYIVLNVNFDVGFFEVFLIYINCNGDYINCYWDGVFELNFFVVNNVINICL